MNDMNTSRPDQASSPKLTVAAVALDIVEGRPDENLATLGRVFTMIPEHTDLVVLPEMFSTGFVNDADSIEASAQSVGGSTVATLTMLAERYHTAIAGSMLARSGTRFYNRGFFIEPSGDMTCYDKHHLFSVSDEAKLLTHGTMPMPVIRYRGWNIAMIVCYDLRFPVWSRNRHEAYDLLLVPAMWPKSRAYAWQHLLIARAIENQCCVVGANRSGADKWGEYDDLTDIYDALGQPIGRRVSRRGSPAPIVVAELSLDELRAVRRRMPVALDADDFEIISGGL